MNPKKILISASTNTNTKLFYSCNDFLTDMERNTNTGDWCCHIVTFTFHIQT